MLTGHSKQKKYFKHVIDNGSLSHAYLFSGPDMIGKKTFALELAGSILGTDLDHNPDFKFIAPKVGEGESKIYIEDVRDFKRFMSLKSYGGDKRLVIFDNAHFLTSEAANALLKILEEPPLGSVIILISSVPNMIPATILSRCEEVRFNELSSREVEIYLADKKLKEDDKEFLATLARGRIGLINNLIENEAITEARRVIDDLRKLFNAGIYEKMDYAKKVHERALRRDSPQGYYSQFVDYWLNWVSVHLRNSPKNEKIVKNLLSLHQIVSQPQYNHRLALENFLLSL